MLYKIKKHLSQPQLLPEKVQIVGGSYLSKLVVKGFEINKSLTGLTQRSKTKRSSGAKTLLCRYENLTQDLISEEKFLLEDTLQEYAEVNPGFTFDQYFWDSDYSTAYSVDYSFSKTVLDGGYKTIILGSWHPDLFWMPSVKAIKSLKKNDVEIIAIWFDSCSDKFIRSIWNLIDLIDKHILVENPLLDLGPHGELLSRNQKSKFRSYCWPFPRNFLESSCPKSIDTVFLGRTGSYRDYRRKYINNLMENNIAGFFFAGDRNSQLSWDEYRRIMSSARISLNFSYSVDRHQLKGRSLQALWANSLLMETKNLQTEVFFKDGIDYVSFDNEKDMVAKIRYYLQNPELAEKIAKNGHKKIIENYNSKKFWSLVFREW